MHATHLKTLATAGFLALLLAAEPASAQDDKKPPQGAAANQGQSQQAIRDGISRVVSRMWWNQPDKIEALALETEKRTKMDGLIRGYLEEQRGSTAMRDAFAAFEEMLAAGDWDAARERAKGLEEAASAPVRGQTEVMITALSLLSAEQRAKVGSDFPGLLSGPWLRMTGMARRRSAGPRSQ